MSLVQTWDLDSLFPGGSDSSEFRTYLDQLDQDISKLKITIEGTMQDADNYVALLETYQDVAKRFRHAGAFVSCLGAQNVKDQAAKILSGRIAQIGAAFSGAMTALDALLLACPDDTFARICSDGRITPLKFLLEERRTRAAAKLDVARENLISDLGVDGYRGWGQLYDSIVGRMAIDLEQNGEMRTLSMGQAANEMLSGTRQTRETVFQKWEEAWSNEAELISTALNHLAGFRLSTYKHRDWSSFLQEPLEIGRMTQETLDVMWDVITQNKGKYALFLGRKAKLLGVERLSWHDVSAPLGESTTKVTYEEARNFILEHFGKFDPNMAAFVEKCFAQRWIEAEDRPGKRPGAFCTSLPVAGQTRVFMTFSGTQSNVSTLAHELGHAYHQHVMQGLPYMLQGYAMNVAETASTFAEAIISDAAVRNARSNEERLALLEDKIGNSVTMFMNIHARFLFETRFYNRRKQGLVGVDELNALMTEAQEEAFCHSLAEYHPHFWASKLHFYNTGTPFYNFPYTFGYLFSTGIYARSLQEGPEFAQKYVDLLRDTGRMRVEDLARKHLRVDLAKADFWQSAIDVLNKDVDLFLEATEA